MEWIQCSQENKQYENEGWQTTLSSAGSTMIRNFLKTNAHKGRRQRTTAEAIYITNLLTFILLTLLVSPWKDVGRNVNFSGLTYCVILYRGIRSILSISYDQTLRVKQSHIEKVRKLEILKSDLRTDYLSRASPKTPCTKQSRIWS